MGTGARVDVGPSAIAVAVSVATAVAIVKTAGEFAYTLDDPYIHLRLSEMIASGTYGINPGEPASPSSSILWPFLLAPFAAAPFHHLVPLALNTVALALTLVLARRTLAQTWTRAPWWGLAALVLASAFILQWFALPFLGLEHSWQILASVACAGGLVSAVVRGRVPWWFWAGAVAGPWIRFDSLAMTLPALAALGVVWRWRPAAVALSASLAGLGVFAAFLVALGLPPVPNSVLAKAGGSLMEIRLNVAGDGPGRLLTAVLLVLLLVGLVAAVRLRGNAARTPWVVALASGVTALALQLLLGPPLDPLGRYPAAVLSYAGILGLASVAVSVPRLTLDITPVTVSIAVVLAVSLVTLRPVAVNLVTVSAARAISDQHGQLHRFVTDHLRAPVALNDLGWMSYRNPERVIDLAGLGSERARLAAASGDPEWISRIVEPAHVPAAVIYDTWFGEAIPDSWVRVGTVETAKVTAAEPVVTIYATAPQHVRTVRAALAEFADAVGPRTAVTLMP